MPSVAPARGRPTWPRLLASDMTHPEQSFFDDRPEARWSREAPRSVSPLFAVVHLCVEGPGGVLALAAVPNFFGVLLMLVLPNPGPWLLPASILGLALTATAAAFGLRHHPRLRLLREGRFVRADVLATKEVEIAAFDGPSPGFRWELQFTAADATKVRFAVESQDPTAFVVGVQEGLLYDPESPEVHLLLCELRPEPSFEDGTLQLVDPWKWWLVIASIAFAWLLFCFLVG